MIKFKKMEAVGNDYIIIDAITNPEQQRLLERENFVELVRLLSDRHFGIGGDGVIFILPPLDNNNDARMRIFNADGSEAEMCGNGIRQVAHHIYNHIYKKNILKIETLAGLKEIKIVTDTQGNIQAIEVNMGKPILRGKDIPINIDKEVVKDEFIKIGDLPLIKFTAVSMGNPHCVIFLEDANWGFSLEEIPLAIYGRALEHHKELFPKGVNVEFVDIVSRGEVRVRVWERGSGETLGCGTGACAVVVAGNITNKLDKTVKVHLPGGTVIVEINENGEVILKGNANPVFEGIFLKNIT